MGRINDRCVPLAAPPVLNQTWTLDFMNDEGNRERLEIAMGTSLPGRRVIRVLNDLVAVHGGQSPYALPT